MTLKKWREIAVPREDVCTGNFQQAEFAADISSVKQHRASNDYQDPEAFFSMTYITSGMDALLKSVLKRITGIGGEPVIQLKTAFGGGKTHSLLAVYHIAKQEKPISSLPGVNTILDELNIIELPKSKVVIIDGTNQDASKPRIYQKVHIKTIWGDIAWQIGGMEAYEKVKLNDIDGTAPTKDTFIDILTQYGPVVILMDELVRYISQFRENKEYSGGTYNSNLSFIQNLTEAVKQVPNAVLLASLPDSNSEAGDEHGQKTLHTLEHYFGRIQAIWRPIETQESFEIVRRRLFKPITDDMGRKEVCKAFAEYYIQNSDSFPPETQESSYYEKLLTAYPIHPQLFENLYNDWSSLPNFQKTRGVLKLMAKVISNLWINGNNDLMIMPGNLPLDSEVKSDFVSYLPSGWDPVIDGDVDGRLSHALKIDKTQPRFGKVLACRKVARTIFLGTAPGSQNKLKPGIDKKDIMLGVIEPEQSIAIYSDALDNISSKFHYLNIGNGEYWFDIRQNLIKEMEERKKRFNNDEDIIREINKILTELIKPSGFIERVHIFTPHKDIPDDKDLRLVILPYNETYTENSQLKSNAEAYSMSILKHRGDELRKYQNRLIFLAADGNCIDNFKDNIISMLAWRSIVEDYENNQLILDNLKAKEAKSMKEHSIKTAKLTVRECYKHLLIPEMNYSDENNLPKDIVWSVLKINSRSQKITDEINKTLKDEWAVFSEWAAIHLKKALSKWYWNKKDFVVEKDFWEDSCRYLYLPRLSTEDVLHKAIEHGVQSKDYFAIAYGYEDGKYIDFRFGDYKSYIKDSQILIINPVIAEKYEREIKQKESESGSSTPIMNSKVNDKASKEDDKDIIDDSKHILKTDINIKKRFFGTVNLRSNDAVNNLMNINDEIIRVLDNSGSDVEITLTLDIEATSKKGFSSDIQRTINENCKNPKINIKDFNFENPYE